MTSAAPRLIFDVECPACRGRAWAEMIPDGIAGTYREATLRMGARRIGCDRCGLLRELPPGRRGEFVLWFRGDLRGHPLWARNEAHLDFLIAWLAGDRSVDGLDLGQRSDVERLPQWMIRHGDEVVRRLRQLKQRR